MALWVRGKSRGDLGQLSAAIADLRKLVALDMSDPREKFYWFGESIQLQEGAAKWLAYYERYASIGPEGTAL